MQTADLRIVYDGIIKRVNCP